MGFFVADGSFGIVAKDGGDVAFLPATSMDCPELRAVQAQYEDAQDSLRADLAASETADRTWLEPELQALPPEIQSRLGDRESALRLQSAHDLRRSDRFFAAVAGQTRLAIIADSFSRSTFIYNALHDKRLLEPTNRANWARRSAYAFRRRYKYSNGILLMRSRQSLWERLVEVPPDLLARLNENSQEQGRLEWPDYAAAASRLTLEQLRTLNVIQTEDDQNYGFESITIERYRPLLQLVGGLPPLARDSKAAGVAELPANATTKALSDLIFWTGVRRPLAPAEVLPATLRVSWRTVEDTVHFEFVAPQKAVAVAHTFMLGPKRNIATRRNPTAPSP